MFNFLNMLDDYEDRKVARYPEEENFLVDTCRVTDSKQPYETAVQHPRYNRGEIVIVQLYDTKEQALEGHEKWVKAMTTEPLPQALIDVSTSGIAELCDVFSGDDWRLKE